MFQIKRLLKVATLAVSALIVIGPQPTRSQDLDTDLAVFDRYVEALRRQLQIPGLSAAIVRGGHTVWSKGYGFQDVEAGVPATPDTIYDIASLTKTFTPRCSCNASSAARST